MFHIPGIIVYCNNNKFERNKFKESTNHLKMILCCLIQIICIILLTEKVKLWLLFQHTLALVIITIIVICDRYAES